MAGSLPLVELNEIHLELAAKVAQEMHVQAQRMDPGQLQSDYCARYSVQTTTEDEERAVFALMH